MSSLSYPLGHAGDSAGKRSYCRGTDNILPKVGAGRESLLCSEWLCVDGGFAGLCAQVFVSSTDHEPDCPLPILGSLLVLDLQRDLGHHVVGMS